MTGIWGWLAFQLRLAYRILGLKDPLVMVCLPSFAGVATRLDHSGLIYYLTDKFDAYRDLKARESMIARDRLLKEESDLLLCSSRKIQEDASEWGDKARYFPHAVDFDRFAAALEDDAPEPADLAAIPHPRIGYFGSLTNANNLDIIRYCAKEDPSLHFVLIGWHDEGEHSATRLRGLPNIHLLGPRPREVLASCIAAMDVMISPYPECQVARVAFPLKAWEALAVGRPLVATHAPELNTHRPFLRIGFLYHFYQFIQLIIRKLFILSHQAQKMPFILIHHLLIC